MSRKFMSRLTDPVLQKRYGTVDIQKATRDELAPVVRKMAKAVNQRMLRLERAGVSYGAYAVAKKNLDGANRFKERTANLSRSDLQREYESLVEFLNSKTASLKGIKQANLKRYKAAQKAGYKGTFDNFMLALNKAWSSANEAMFDSSTIYEAIVEDEVDIIEAIVAEQPEQSMGEALNEYYRRSEARRKKNKKKKKSR